MKVLILLCLLAGASQMQQTSAAGKTQQLMCYYDSSAYSREGLARLALAELEPALQFCSHLIYGYATINRNSNKLVPKNEKLESDLNTGLYITVTNLKKKHPHLKVLLSVGGDKDEVDKDDNKYLNFLESSNARTAFVNSVHTIVKDYGFDGIDIGWQFPKNKPKKQHSGIGKIWKGFKKIFPGGFVLDEKAEEHRDEFTALIKSLKGALYPEGLILGVTILPNVNSSVFYDVPAIINNLDYINLNAFDFQTPDRNPEVADFPAPIYELNERNPESNINYQVQYLLNNHCPPSKIIVSVAAYGRAWKMTKDSGLTGLPPVLDTDKAAPAGIQTKTEGLLSWPEICAKLPNSANQHLKGADAPLRKVGDPTKRFGNYAFRLADDNNENGIWVGYDDPDTAANKAAFVKSKFLGGVALVDLSFDDFRGSCSGDKYPILRAIKYQLQ